MNDGPGFQRWGLLAVAALGALWAACSDKDEARPSANGPGGDADVTSSATTALPEGASADEVLEAAQRAVDASEGYTIVATQSNLVLPEWGGSDGGRVEVGRDGDVARAELDRTGDGRYTIVLAGGETLFQRSTCSMWTRRSGGGRDVLRPFLLAQNRVLSTAAKARVLSRDASVAVVEAKLDGLAGIAKITIDAATSRVMQIDAPDGTNNRRPLTWRFENWDEAPEVSKPTAARDGGPGGNPC